MLSRILKHVRLASYIIIALLFAVFSAVNRDIVELSLYPFDYALSLPEYLYALLFFLLGALVASLVMGKQLTKTKHLYGKMHKRATALENELAGLRLDQTAPLPVTQKINV
ncbi:MAG: lipopolysaccharide assembly protein LapA domain-containing protein [Rickettsiales bacterium]|nr:lipopolysaccharide assembly protein LapA domain-containing protein [Rickettsiales bacterium]